MLDLYVTFRKILLQKRLFFNFAYPVNLHLHYRKDIHVVYYFINATLYFETGTLAAHALAVTSARTKKTFLTPTPLGTTKI